MLKNRKNELVIQISLLAVYAIVNMIFLILHEPWRDEAQAWVIARELSPIGIIQQMAVEGHPCLWHFIIMPFAKLGFPYITINIISYIIMLIAAVLLVFKAPFGNFVKAFILFSPLFTYYLSVIARSYCLIPLFLVLLAIFYEKRFEKPIIYGLLLGLIVQTNIIIIGLPAVMSAIWMFEIIYRFVKEKDKKLFIKRIIGLCIPAISAAILFFMIINVKNTMVSGNLNEGLIIDPSTRRGGLLLFHLIALCIMMLILFLTTLLLRKKCKDMYKYVLMFFVPTIIYFVIGITVYDVFSLQKRFVFIGVFVLSLWLANLCDIPQKLKDFLKCFTIVAMLILIFNFILNEDKGDAKNDIYGEYSGAKAVSEYIDKNVPKDAVIITNDATSCTAVSAYFNDRDFWYAVSGEKTTYTKWDDPSAYGSISYNDMIIWAKEKFPDKDGIYLLAGWIFNDGSTDRLQKGLKRMDDFKLTDNMTVLFENNMEYNSRWEVYSLVYIDLKSS